METSELITLNHYLSSFITYFNDYPLTIIHKNPLHISVGNLTTHQRYLIKYHKNYGAKLLGNIGEYIFHHADVFVDLSYDFPYAPNIKVSYPF